jgi:hypothetical protein
MNARETLRERNKARKWIASLTRKKLFELGDALVLGSFDWREWFDEKPSSVFLAEADIMRIFREEESET